MSFDKPWGNYLLDAIVETRAPESISFWPQTLAWQLIFILIVISALKKGYRSWKNYQDNAYRREALAWLALCSLSNEGDVRQLPTLLRKTAILANDLCRHNENSTTKSALAIEQRHEINKLTGHSWATWLDKHCLKTQFSQKTVIISASSRTNEELLTQLAYLPKLELSDEHFIEALKQLYLQIELWIKYHNLSDESQQENLGVQT